MSSSLTDSVYWRRWERGISFPCSALHSSPVKGLFAFSHTPALLGAPFSSEMDQAAEVFPSPWPSEAAAAAPWRAPGELWHSMPAQDGARMETLPPKEQQA